MFTVLYSMEPNVFRYRVKVQGKAIRRKVSFVHAAAGGADEEDDELLGADDEEEVGGGTMEMGTVTASTRTPAKVTFKDGDVENSDDSEGEEEEEEEEEELGPCLHFMSAPLRFMFEWTCPDAEEGAKYEKWYVLALFPLPIWQCAALELCMARAITPSDCSPSIRVCTAVHQLPSYAYSPLLLTVFDRCVSIAGCAGAVP